MKTLKTLFPFVIVVLPMLVSCGKKSNETKPIRKDITETVFASGALVPENQYNMTAQSEGYLIKLNFTEGDTVNKGDVLAVIENKPNDYNSQSANALLSIAGSNASPNGPALKQVSENIELAKLKLKQDELQEVRYKKLYDEKSVSKLEYENITLAKETSKANLAALQENYNVLKQQADRELIIQQSQSNVNGVLQGNNEIKAVIGGKVFNKMKQLGDYVRKGDVIAIIGDKDNLYAKLNIDETNISRIKVDQKVIIQLNTDKNKNYDGVVTEIYPSFSEQTQSFSCKVKFTSNLDFDIAGTQLQGNIVLGNKSNVLVIPKEYLGYGSKVNIKGKGQTTVETGFVSNDWVEITKGIDESTVIVLE